MAGFLASPIAGAIIGAMGTPSGGNAGQGALQGMLASSNVGQQGASTQLMKQEAQDREDLNKYFQLAGQGMGMLNGQNQQYSPNVGILGMPQTSQPPAPQSVPPPIMMAPQPAPPPQAMPAPMPQQPQAPAMPAQPPPRPPQSSQAMPQATPAQPPPQAPAPMAAPPAPSQAPSVGAWKGMPPGGMLQGGAPSLGPMFQQMLKYPHSRAAGLQGLLSMNKPPDKGTGLMQNLAAAGLSPGTPEYQSAMMQAVTKPMVSMTQGKPPAGYEWGADGSLTAIEGGPATKPSDAAVKQQVQSEIGMRLLDEVDTLVQEGVETGTGAWAKANAASSPLLSWAVELSADEAKVASNLEMLSNIMLAAQRGAQVGPEEQKRYDKQLPRLGQEKSLFTANLAATKRNLKEMTTRMVEVRKQKQGQPPPPPPGFTIVQ